MKNKLIIFIGLLVLIACIVPVAAGGQIASKPSHVTFSPEPYTNTSSVIAESFPSMNETYYDLAGYVPMNGTITGSLNYFPPSPYNYTISNMAWYSVNIANGQGYGKYTILSSDYYGTAGFSPAPSETSHWVRDSYTAIHFDALSSLCSNDGMYYLVNFDGDGDHTWSQIWRVGGDPPAPVANFDATPASGIVPLSVIFNDTSTAYPSVASWLWNFGDGYTATTQNATHVYTATGNYSASLAIATSTNETASVAKTITVSAPSDYFIPTIVSDAFTGNLIFNSSLSSEEYGTSAAHNWTGSYGEYNVTGKGSLGIDPIEYGDYIYLMASAPGYSPNDVNYHVTIRGQDMFVKNIPLCPLYVAPIAGESTMILDVYNNVTGAPITGAFITAGDESSWKTGYTDNRGVFYYGNISSSRHITVTASASGYQTGNLEYYAPTGGVNYVSIGLDPGITVSNFWPVTIVDATTGYALANSELDVKEDLSGAAWYNQTSTTGKFNVTGVGNNATLPIVNNMDVYLYGQASGYNPYGYIIMMSPDNNKVLQQIALTPISSMPTSGYFTANYQVYDKISTIAISGASVKQYCSGLTKIGAANSAGIFSTVNNTVGTCSYTVSKSGYSTITGTFTGADQEIKAVLVPMSRSSVNPTATATTATTRTTISTGPTTIVPATTGGNYTGFWAPYYQMFHAMGAQDTELGVLMTACLIIFLLVIIGIISGGNLYAINSAAALGFILSCAFGWIYFWLILAGVLWLLIPLVFRRVE